MAYHHWVVTALIDTIHTNILNKYQTNVKFPVIFEKAMAYLLYL